MNILTTNFFTRFVPHPSVIAGAALGALMFPLSAMADMRTLDRSEMAGLEEVEGSGYINFYQHPDLGSIEFRSVYIEPVENAMPLRDVYDLRLRPEYIDDLAADFHQKLLTAFETTGLLTDEPDEHTLVISPSLVFVTEYDERSTGSNLSSSQSDYRIRGNTIMEMTWRAGPGGQIVAAIHDGRAPHIYTPVTDREDRFTDARDTFEAWAWDLAAFFGAEPRVATN